MRHDGSCNSAGKLLLCKEELSSGKPAFDGISKRHSRIERCAGDRPEGKNEGDECHSPLRWSSSAARWLSFRRQGDHHDAGAPHGCNEKRSAGKMGREATQDWGASLKSNLVDFFLDGRCGEAS